MSHCALRFNQLPPLRPKLLYPTVYFTPQLGYLQLGIQLKVMTLPSQSGPFFFFFKDFGSQLMTRRPSILLHDSWRLAMHKTSPIVSSGPEQPPSRPGAWDQPRACVSDKWSPREGQGPDLVAGNCRPLSKGPLLLWSREARASTNSAGEKGFYSICEREAEELDLINTAFYTSKLHFSHCV